MRLSSGEWILHLGLQILQYRQNIQDVNDQLLTFANLSKSVNERINSTNFTSLKPTVLEYKNTLLNKIVWLEGDFNKIMSHKTGKRATRGLVDVIGHGLHYLIGTATDDQVNDLSDRLHQLAGNTEDALNARYSFLSNVSDTLQRHDAMLSRSLKALQNLEVSVDNLNNMTQDLYNVEIFLQCYLNLHVAFLSLSRHIADLQKSLRQLRDNVMVAESGRLSPFLIPPSQLNNAIRDASRRLPPNFSFLNYPMKSTAIYGTARAKLLRREEIIEILITLPLYQNGMIFNIFRAHPLPSPLGNSTNAVMLQPDSPYIACNAERDRYLLLPAEFTLQCRNGDIFLCPPIFPILTGNVVSCNIAAFLNQTQKIKKYCGIHLIGSNYSKFLKGEAPGDWIFSVSKVIALSIVCPLKQYSLNVHGQGKFNLPPGCSASDGTIYLPPTANTFESGISTNISLKIEPLLITAVSILDNRYRDVINQSASLKNILDSMDRLDSHSLPSVPLSHIESVVKLMSPLESHVKIINYSSIALVGIAVVVIIIVISRIIKMQRREGKAAEAALTVVNVQQTVESERQDRGMRPLFPNAPLC